jgi:dephospho-CoA kinase
MLRRFLATTVAMASAAVARSPPVVVGLTGSIGMGKSTASNWLKSAGIKVHDADACVHALYAPNGPAVAPVCAAFPGVEATDGSIDRAKLSAALRQPGASIETLNKIVHPLVTADRDAFVLRAAADGEWLVVLDIPLLLETMDATTRYRLLDAIVVVSAPADIQRARVLARPGMTADKFEFILSKQVPDADKRAAADFIIETGHESFAPARAQLARCLQSLAETHRDAFLAWRDSAATPGPAVADAPPAGDAGGCVVGVSVDLDDTLWPTMPPLIEAQKARDAALAELLPKVHASGAFSASAFRGATKALMAEQPLLDHDFTALQQIALRRLAVEHGDDPENANRVLERFLDARSDVFAHFFAETVPCLEALRARLGLRVGSVTNGNCDVRRHEAVSANFDFAVTAADAGAAKPHAAPFLLAAAAAGCRPCQLVHIGDDPTTDLIGALDAGCRAVLVTRPPEPEGPSDDAQVKAWASKAEPTAPLPDPDPARWREVASLEEAVSVVEAWQREPHPKVSA